MFDTDFSLCEPCWFRNLLLQCCSSNPSSTYKVKLNFQENQQMSFVPGRRVIIHIELLFWIVTKHKHNSDFLLLVDKKLEIWEMGTYVAIMMYYLGGNLMKITAHLKLKVGENGNDKVGFNPFGCSSMRQHSCFRVLRYVHLLPDPIIPLSSSAPCLPLHICIHICAAMSLLLCSVTKLFLKANVG